MSSRTLWWTGGKGAKAGFKGNGVSPIQWGPRRGLGYRKAFAPLFSHCRYGGRGALDKDERADRSRPPFLTGISVPDDPARVAYARTLDRAAADDRTAPNSHHMLRPVEGKKCHRGLLHACHFVAHDSLNASTPHCLCGRPGPLGDIVVVFIQPKSLWRSCDTSYSTCDTRLSEWVARHLVRCCRLCA